MAARPDEPKGTREEKKAASGMAGMMDRCTCMSEADMSCCEPKDKPAPGGEEA